MGELIHRIVCERMYGIYKTRMTCIERSRNKAFDSIYMLNIQIYNCHLYLQFLRVDAVVGPQPHRLLHHCQMLHTRIISEYDTL